MIKRFIRNYADTVVFMFFLYGLLYFLLIVANKGTVYGNMKFFFWNLLPLVVFGLLFGLVESVRKTFFPKKKH